MPESKSEQVRHSNEEVWNFLMCGDARGPGWIAAHPADRERAQARLRSRSERPLDPVPTSQDANSPFPSAVSDGGLPA